MSAFGLTHGLLDLSLLRVVEKNFQRVWGKQKARNVKVNDDFDTFKIMIPQTTRYQQTPSTAEISFGGGGLETESNVRMGVSTANGAKQL